MRLPKRIILVRHGESKGNLDGSAYTTTPDYKIPLTELGLNQARTAGQNILQIIQSQSESETENNWKVYFYVSPYERTRSTLREIGKSFNKKQIIGSPIGGVNNWSCAHQDSTFWSFWNLSRKLN
ncbi:hypothetical protein MKW92_033772 [Papaver armeniacum]|nr:hypothetical protein MKW92_033772 [Papaver armeniacum]